MEKLLHKVLQSDVIEEVRGKLSQFSEDTGYLYRFVTEPGPFNFLESPRKSPLGKHAPSYDGTCITNEYAFIKCDDGEEVTKKARSSVVNKLAVFDVNSQTLKLSPQQLAGVWKEFTLSR